MGRSSQATLKSKGYEHLKHWALLILGMMLSARRCPIAYLTFWFIMPNPKGKHSNAPGHSPFH